MLKQIHLLRNWLFELNFETVMYKAEKNSFYKKDI
jgi:hypothetical protein